MNYPSINEYIEAIRFAEDNFEQLKHLRPVLGGDGEPVMTSGNFAVVFKMKDEQTGKFHAVKCFLREQEGRAEAYRQIAEELEYVSSTFLTPIKYLDKELFVDTNAGDDKEFPVLLMDWVEGETLDKYIRKHLNDQYELSLLAYQFSRLAMWLMPQPFAHGDLKPDNILVKNDGTLVLVDYDGMYVPAMKGQRARELGSPDFRHPSRTETDFDEHIDDFSLATILLALKAISLQPSLLGKYGALDRLLFSEKDYRNLSESTVMDALKPLMHDAELASLYSLFILAASQNNLSGVSFRLFNLNRPSVSSTNNCLRILQINKKIVNKSNKRIIKKEVLASFQGKKDVIHFINSDGTESWVANKLKFLDEVKRKGGSRIKTIENDKMHVIYLYDDNDNEIGKYNIVEQFHGKAPKTISEIKDNVIVLEVWVDSIKKWILGIGLEKQTSKELLPSFQGKENVWHIVDSNGTESYLTQECSFVDEIYLKGACKLNTVENDKKHVLFLFNIRDEEVGRYYLGKKLQGLTPAQLTDIKHEIVVFDSWNPETNAWVPCVGKAKEGSWNIEQEEFKTDVTDLDLANAWTDEFGVKYSVDGKRLLSAPNNLKEYIVRDGTNCICDHTFEAIYEPANLEHISIPNSVKAIGYSSFYGCAFENIDLPESLLYIGADAFCDCFRLKKLSLPNSLISIDNGAFQGCTSLEEISIPGSLKFMGRDLMGYDIFYGCKSLNCIYVPEGTKAYYDSLLPEWKDIIQEQRSKREINDGKIQVIVKKWSLLAFAKEHGKMQVGEFVDKETGEVFKSCIFTKPDGIRTFVSFSSKLGVLTPKEIVEMKDNLDVVLYENDNYSLCKRVNNWADIDLNQQEENLSTVVTDEDLANAWTDEYGVTYSKDGLSLLSAQDINSVEYTIKEGTQMICDHAFSSCTSLRSIEIPNSVKVIGEASFMYCHSLLSIIIPGNVKVIKDCAFSGCTSLKEVSIQKGLTSIGGSAFSHCESLKVIIIPDSVSSFGNLIDDGYTSWNGEKASAFDYCDSLESIMIPKGARGQFEKLLPDYKEILFEKEEVPSTKVFSNDYKNVWIDDFGVKYSPDRKRLIRSTKGLKEYSVLEGTNIICDVAFSEIIWRCANSNYIGLTTITIPNSVTAIGEGVFSGCQNLVSVYIPFGTKKRFEELLPEYKDKLVEQEMGWIVKSTRPFSSEEILLVARAEVVPSQYGNSVCFFMNTGGQTYIPLSKQSKLTVGDVLDIKTAKLITLCRKGKSDITRVIE